MKKIIFLFIVFNFFNCQSVDKRPDPTVLFSEDKMVEILTEIALIKASKITINETITNAGISVEKYLHSKHNIDSLSLVENLDYYTYTPFEYKKILQRVSDSLTLKYNVLDSIFIDYNERIDERLDEIENNKD